jgi:pentatricopeptide repeat protein
VHGLGVRQNAVEAVTRKPPHRTQARSLFDEVPVRDVVTCSAAIYRHARSGLFHESAGLFVSMMRAGVCPNSVHLGRCVACGSWAG